MGGEQVSGEYMSGWASIGRFASFGWASVRLANDGWAYFVLPGVNMRDEEGIISSIAVKGVNMRDEEQIVCFGHIDR